MFGLLMNTLGLLSQNITIRGTVRDPNNEPVIGATIILRENVSKGTVSDYDGNFTLSDVPSNATLQISYVECQLNQSRFMAEQLLILYWNQMHGLWTRLWWLAMAL